MVERPSAYLPLTLRGLLAAYASLRCDSTRRKSTYRLWALIAYVGLFDSLAMRFDAVTHRHIDSVETFKSRTIREWHDEGGLQMVNSGPKARIYLQSYPNLVSAETQGPRRPSAFVKDDSPVEDTYSDHTAILLDQAHCVPSSRCLRKSPHGPY